MTNWQGITGVNRAYVLELYDRYLKDPNAVDAETRALFATWTPPAEVEPAAGTAGQALGDEALRKAVLAVNLAQSIRKYGHLAAKLDPLDSPPIGDPSLHAATHGLTDDDLRALPPTLISSPLAEGAANMLDVVDRFRKDMPDLFDEVVTVQEFAWSEQPWIRGSFGGPPVGGAWMIAEWTKPEGRIHFAGDFTTMKSGWVEGAIESGLRAARQIDPEAKPEAEPGLRQEITG